MHGVGGRGLPAALGRAQLSHSCAAQLTAPHGLVGVCVCARGCVHLRACVCLPCNTATRACRKVKQGGFAPTARCAYGMCTFGKEVVIFGGRDAAGRCNDVHVLDTEAWTWTAVTIAGANTPAKVSFHSMSAIGNCAVVVGGESVPTPGLARLPRVGLGCAHPLAAVRRGGGSRIVAIYRAAAAGGGALTCGWIGSD